MTLTPLDVALASMAAPLPGVDARRSSSTLAPLVMSASAWVCIVLALPCALSTLKSARAEPGGLERLREVRAVERLVAGRRGGVGQQHADRPLPLRPAASACAIAEKSVVNDVAVTVTDDPLDELAVVAELEELVVPARREADGHDSDQGDECPSLH